MARVDHHRNVQVAFRVPPDEAEDAKLAFQAARAVGWTTALARLAGGATEWEPLWAALQAALPRVQAAWPGPDAPPESPEALLQWVVTVAPEAASLAHGLQRGRQELARLQTQIREARQRAQTGMAGQAADLQTQLQTLQDQIAAEQRRWRLTQRATQLVIELAEHNWTTEDLAVVGQLIRAARVRPETYLELWQHYGGLEALIRQLEPEIQRLTHLRQQIMAELQALGRQAQQAQAATDAALAKLRQVQAGVQRAEAERAEAQAAAREWRQIAASLGWWIPDITETWHALGTQTAGVERALAATLLLHALQRDGDQEWQLPGRTEARRFRLPVPVLLSELIQLLSPPEFARQLMGQLAAPTPTPAAAPATAAPPSPVTVPPDTAAD
jgi:predicted  nucleic acid-binding Zn-ribbon protein